MRDNLQSGTGRSNSRPQLTLVLPCYNEEAVLKSTATRLLRCFAERQVRLELVLVDNGSEDNTGQIIDQLIESGEPVVKVRIAVNQGYGNGILEGLKVAGGDLVGFLCADGQVEAESVFKIFEIASNSVTPKLVKVRRRFRMDGFTRKMVSVSYNLITMLLFGRLRSIDINGNPKIFPRQYLDLMRLESKDWFLDAEVMIKAKRLGLEVLEFNVMAQMREGGKSNVRAGTCWEFLENLFRYRFGEKRKRVFLKGLEETSNNRKLRNHGSLS